MGFLLFLSFRRLPPAVAAIPPTFVVVLLAEIFISYFGGVYDESTPQAYRWDTLAGAYTALIGCCCLSLVLGIKHIVWDILSPHAADEEVWNHAATDLKQSNVYLCASAIVTQSREERLTKWLDRGITPSHRKEIAIGILYIICFAGLMFVYYFNIFSV